MTGCTTWSYAPYKPLLFDVGDIYICRVVPYETSIHFEWLPKEGSVYTIYYKLREAEDFLCAGETKNTGFDITGLDIGRDYCFYVSCGGDKSRVRLARTGSCVGVTINYLHPEDDAYAFSGQYLCSPSLLRHPDGYLLASMDLFGHNTPQNLTLIFRSDDDGKTWHYVSELFPCFWGKLFLHEGALYMLACSTEYGDLLIGRSDNGGKTFCTPSVLLRGSCKTNVPGVHKNPQNILRHNGRIYETLEWGSWAQSFHAPMVMSCDEKDDLLDPASWHFTPPVKYDPTWPGVAEGPSSGNIEGTLVVFPDGKLYNVMRYDMSKTTPSYGLVLAYLVDTEDPDAPLTYSHAIRFPANHAKFMIKYDAQTATYYSIACRILSSQGNWHRNLLSLMRSRDMVNWEVACDLIDKREEDPNKTGFQYVDFEIEGDDIIAQVRTAWNQANNFHDTNYSTFLKIPNFRSNT